MKISATYDYDAFYSGNFIQKWWKRQIAETVWSWMPNSEFLRVIDLGCGSSPIVAHYDQGATPIAVDTDIDKAAWMTKRFPHVNVLPLDARYTGFLNGSFNGVLAIEVIEHIPDSENLIKEISRLLERGGRAIIATPDYHSLIWLAVEATYKLIWPEKYCDDHVSRYNLKRLKNECWKHGLKFVRHRRVAGADIVAMFEKL